VLRNTTATPVTAPQLPTMDRSALKVSAVVREAEYGRTVCLRKSRIESMLQLLVIKQVNLLYYFLQTSQIMHSGFKCDDLKPHLSLALIYVTYLNQITQPQNTSGTPAVVAGLADCIP